MKKYNHQKIEKKWQKEWARKKIYQAKDKAKGRKNKMLLTEFPYPSGNLHIGHWFAFAVPDILARYFRMRGENVMYPIGFDAFGLPAENAAIKRKINPRDWTEKNIKFMTKQLESMGASFDWSRKVSTIDPEYYKWTQWLFLQMHKKGLVYRAKTPANWCPSCKTVLANEQVIQKSKIKNQKSKIQFKNQNEQRAETEIVSVCERCETQVIQKELEQWMFKITDYADKLIDDIEGLDWPEMTKLAQKNWIGRSEGAEIEFRIKNQESRIKVFTTRADTLFGATYVVLAPEHHLVASLLENQESRIKNQEEVEKYIKETQRKTDLERQENKEKTGVELKGIIAINPANGEEVPIWISDYVLASYGTGAVMAVPAHDQRDWDFAKKFDLSIMQVIEPPITAVEKGELIITERAYEEGGVLINSGDFTGMESENARREIVGWLEKEDKAERKKNYRLRDWVLSRQRYWGVPIPLIFCENCKKLAENSKLKTQNSKLQFKIKDLKLQIQFTEKELENPGWIAVLEKDLPVKLPPLKDFLPTDDGRSPLAKAKKWVNVKCPKCKGRAERETDTMDTFVDSSWYFIRYTDPKNKKKFADAQKMKNWLPVPMYIGGAEHNTMHLLYSRFFTKVLYDLKLINFKEPFVGRRNHGIILGPDGQKMSKSKGNVVDPDAEVKKYGADCVRMYLAFMGPYEQGGPWNPTGILGIKRFLDRVYALAQKFEVKSERGKEKSADKNIEKLLHKTIKKVTEDIENFRFNTAISAMMILVNGLEKESNISVILYSKFLILLSPFAPHLTEEIWSQIRANPLLRGKNLRKSASIFLEKWPKYDQKLIKEDTYKLIVQINGKMRGVYEATIGLSEDDAKEMALAKNEILKWTEGKEIRKIIFVKDKLINFILTP